MTTLILRHRTAMTRPALSQPVSALLRYGLLGPGVDFLDFGCGRGDDVRRLASEGVDAVGWDPHFAPDGARRRSQVVNLGFVLNVIEAEAERREVLGHAWDLTSGVLAVSVMIQGQARVDGLRALGDGFVTSRDTFQKYYLHPEVRDLVREVTSAEPVSVAPGILFVFRRSEEEQDFLFERRRGRSAFPTLSPRRARVTVVRPDWSDRVAIATGEIAGLIFRRGRMPQADELSEAASDELARERVSFARASRYAREAVLDGAAFTAAVATRREDLLVHQSLGILNGARDRQAWSLGMLRDMRAHFGSREQLAREAMEYLHSLADAGRVTHLCAEAAETGLGAKDEKGRLIVRGARVQGLAGPLRCYVGCATHLAGELDGPHLVRLDPVRRQVKFFALAREDATFPSVTHAVLVDLRRQDVHLRPERLTLTRKSRIYEGSSRRQRVAEARRARERGTAPDQMFEAVDASQDDRRRDIISPTGTRARPLSPRSSSCGTGRAPRT